MTKKSTLSKIKKVRL